MNMNTPCFILDELKLKEGIEGFKNALDSFLPFSIIGYSVKTNPLPYCLKLARQYGCFAEVVSYNEYNLALKCGFEKDHIIYNGPMKSKDTFLDAIENGAIVNLETFREIEWLKELPPEKVYPIGIRLNIDISQISPADENHTDDNSRFGFSAESSDFEDAISLINQIKQVRLAGIHTHRTSKTRSLSFYKNAILYAQEVIQKYSLNLDYWDLGGGYFGIMPNKPTYLQYAQTFADALREENRKLTIIVEPGNALTALAFDYVSTVIDTKYHNHQYFITTDGSRIDVDPLFHKSDYFKSFEYDSPNEVKFVDEKQLVCGCTCLENDRLFVMEGGKRLLQPGDKILYNRVGAYTLCLTPLFIRYFPRVYLKDMDNKLSLIREEWTENEFVCKSAY
jgi:diaminopimelate decarboxylase